ncbi:MAG: sensor histidine kinase [Eubacteriales bacterium]|nr:sensor histidine kinase [Eubacteriales bacterium]
MDEGGYSRWRTLWRYLADHRNSAVIFVGVFGLFAVIFTLYRLPWEPLLYGTLISLCALLVVGALSFVRYDRRHREMLAMLARIPGQPEELPAPRTLGEEDFALAARALYAERAALISQSDSRVSDMTDYYTLWAHQIKVPLSAMHLLVEDAPRSTDLEQELFKVEQYVEMVLQYLRLESISGDLMLKEYALEDLVRRAAKKYALLFIHSKVSLRMEDFHFNVITDEKWLGFVLEQLLSNALKYTREGDVSVYLEPWAKCTLVIEDTGIGIRPEDIPRVFDRGFTGYNGRMDRKSTGIGLYLCREILRKLGHPIRLESEVGKGTRVLLDLSQYHATE